MQPLTGLFTVSVYIPDTLTVGCALLATKLPGPFQAYITPGVEELPASISVGCAHVSVPPPAEIFGKFLSSVTCTVVEAVQSLIVLVTVNVYIPCVLALAKALLPKPPDQL